LRLQNASVQQGGDDVITRSRYHHGRDHHGCHSSERRHCSSDVNIAWMALLLLLLLLNMLIYDNFYSPDQ